MGSIYEEIKDDIAHLYTINDYISKVHIEKKQKEILINGWEILVEYISGDELVLVGRGNAKEKGATFFDHLHENEVNIITLLTGSLQIDYTDGSNEVFILKEPLNSKVILPRKKHKITSLENNTSGIFITIPADPGYIKFSRD